MKIEDIKPGDVIVRTGVGWLFKVAEVTPDRTIMQSANGKMNEVFCIFSEPQILGWFIEDDYEPATEEQRQYMDSKFAAISVTSPEAESKRITALASMMGDLKQENTELVERVKQLMNDYNKVAKQLRNQPLYSDLTEALDKVEKLERDRDLFYKEYEKGQRLYESLLNQYDAQTKDLNTVREACEAAKEQYNELQRKHTVLFLKNDAANAELQKVGDTLKQLQDDKALLREQLDIANANCKKAEEKRVEANEKIKEQRREILFAFRHYRRFEHADFLSMEHDCPHYTGAEVEVGDLSCLNCAHFLKADLDKTKHILCAYNYDKEKEKQQEEDKFHRKMNSSLNS